MAGAAVGAAGSIVGGMMGADAADDAADAQREATQAGIAEQRRQYDQSREDMAPWRNTGTAALNQLSYLLGLSPNASTGVAPALTREQLREQLLPQFTTTQTTGASAPRSLSGLTTGAFGLPTNAYTQVSPTFNSPNEFGQTPVLINNGVGPAQTTRDVIDEAGLNAAIEKRLAEQAAAQKAAQAGAENDPRFGSLLRRFSMDDYLEDPGYQFRLDQGEQAINRAAAAAGRYDSGRALKDLTEFNSGLASQEFGNAYNRWNNDMSNIFNRLSGVAGTGQQAVNTLSSLGQSTANNISDLQTQGGNARASGYVGQANAWGNALGGLANTASGYLSNRNPWTVGSGFNMNPLSSSIANLSSSYSFA